MIKSIAFKTKGMQRDLAASAFTSEFAYENKNIRITATDDNTLLSIVNEKGNSEIIFCKYNDGDIVKDTNLKIVGTPIGVASINEYIVLFTHDNVLKDFIYYIKIDNDKFILQELYAGNLGFSKLNPIETLASYENDDVIKVYWVDGKNQPRVINIVAPKEVRNNWTDLSFDFIQELQLLETLEVEKQYNSGSFSSGVIQYAFNYYNKNGQESNIVEVSPLQYISYEDRGADADDYVSNSFKITISNVDNHFDYLRIYSIHRTSIDATPSVKLVTDLVVGENTKLTYIDTGTIGEIIDPVELLYKGGEWIIPQTLAQKDGTLFLGNIKQKPIKQLKEDTPPSNEFNEDKYPVHYWRTQSYYRLSIKPSESILMFSWDNEKVVGMVGNLTGYYPYKSYLGRGDNTTYKSKETYRLGIQFQESTGKWSEPIFYNDVPVNKTPILDGSLYKGVTGKLYISKKIIEWAKSNNYKKVRPVVVYPQESEREVIAQGILCPTVFNAMDRHSGTCFAQSSWFFRPNAAVTILEDETTLKSTTNDFWESDSTYIPELGAWPEFRHYYPLPDLFKRNAELQSTIAVSADSLSIDTHYLDNYTPYGYSQAYLNKASELFKDSFYIDQSIVTFHSPEIELQKIFNIDSSIKLRIVGYSEFDANAGDIDITLEDTGIDGSLLTHLYKGVEVDSGDKETSRSLLSGLFYLDYVTPLSGSPLGSFKASSMVYPWNSSGPLNAWYNKDNENDTYKYGSVLKSKKMSNLKFSKNSNYLIDTFELSGNIGIFDGINPLNVPIPEDNTFEEWSPYYSDIRYKGNIDNIIVPDFSDVKFKSINKSDLSFNFKDGRPRAVSTSIPIGDSSMSEKIFFNEDVLTIENFSKDPISIKYKSTPHAVMFMKYSGSNQVVLPSIKNNTFDTDRGNISYGGVSSGGIETAIPEVELPSISKGYLWLAELYREDVPNKFGGNNYESNLWYPAGKSVIIDSAEDIFVEFTQGDTFYSRFDSLKTYPYTLEDTNSIVEIGSFMVETRINLDARYDRNRGKKSNLVMTPTNFNLFNEVYNQRDTFFNYRIKDEKYGDTTNFPNLITYTKTKTAGELVDTWTNITLASTLDLDGDKGEVTALRRLNNNIIAFQNTGISQILYNENVQIASTEGVPIEIANSGKVTGKRYISDKIGCTNKWSICETPSGLYFIDDVTKGIYLFNGQLNNISDRLGFNSWINKHSNLSVWNPEEFSNFITYYDKVNGDVLFVNKDECLAFSEALGQFTSFYSYEGMSFFTSLKGKGISFKDKNDGNFTTWLHNEGDYNMYYGYYKPFYTTVIANPNPTTDKVFNNLEFRADSWKWNGETNKWDLLNDTFDTLTTWNEYQEGTLALNNRMYRPSSLKRKFRIWRANVPRDKSNGRDRMRNPWLYIKLSKETENTNKTILHDMIVSYFE